MENLGRRFFPRFLIAGVLNTLGATLIISISYRMLGAQIGIWASTLVGYSIAVIAAYFFSSRWVFQVSGGFQQKFPMYVLLQGISGAGIASVAHALFWVFTWPALLSHLFAVGLMLPLSFFGQKWLFQNRSTDGVNNARS